LFGNSTKLRKGRCGGPFLFAEMPRSACDVFDIVSASFLTECLLLAANRPFKNLEYRLRKRRLSAISSYRNLARRRDIMIAATHEPLFGQADDTPLFQNRKLQNHTATKACSTSEAWRCDLFYIRVIVVHRNVLCTRIRRVVSPKSVTFRHRSVTHKLVA